MPLYDSWNPVHIPPKAMSATPVQVDASTSIAAGDPISEKTSFVVQFRSALNAELIAEMQQPGPCKAGLLQCNLAAVMQDNARPILLLQGVRLAVDDVLTGEASLEVMRRPLPEEAATRLRKAREAVSHVKSDQLQDVKSLKMPPEAIHDVLAAILQLLGRWDYSWVSIRKVLGERNLVQRLLALEPYQVSFESQLAVQQTVTKHRQSFEYDTIRRVSTATTPMARLVLAFIECWEPMEIPYWCSPNKAVQRWPEVL